MKRSLPQSTLSTDLSTRSPLILNVPLSNTVSINSYNFIPIFLLPDLARTVILIGWFGIAKGLDDRPCYQVVCASVFLFGMFIN